MVAAIQAESPEHAQSAVVLSYDKKSKSMDWRFCNEREDTWEPFCERFPRADWMKWTPLQATPQSPLLTDAQLLDKIYHAIPRWVHQTWPEVPLSDRVKNAIQRLEEVHWKEVLNHVDTRSTGNGFASFLCQKLGKDFGEMYWEYCETPEYQELKKQLMVPKKVVDNPA